MNLNEGIKNKLLKLFPSENYSIQNFWGLVINYKHCKEAELAKDFILTVVTNGLSGKFTSFKKAGNDRYSWESFVKKWKAESEHKEKVSEIQKLEERLKKLKG